MVRLVISSEYFGNNESQIDIKRQMLSWGAMDISFVENGTVTAVMSEIKFEEFINSIKLKTENYISDIVKKYNNIREINHDNFFMNFEVIGKDFTDDLMKLITIEIFIAVSSLQVFDGVPQIRTTVNVVFKNRKNGRSIKIIDSDKDIKK